MYYDQDIMNIASYDWPARFYALPRSFNWRWRPERDMPADEWGSVARICVEHFSNRDYDDSGRGRPALFEYWRDYRRIARKSAPRRVREVGAPSVPWDWNPGTGESRGPLRPGVPRASPAASCKT